MTHPCVSGEPPRSLRERSGISSPQSIQPRVAPDPTLTSPLLPCPHLLMLFGMSCQATASVNTAPGNSDRKPPRPCGKLDAITVHARPFVQITGYLRAGSRRPSLLFCSSYKTVCALCIFRNNQHPNLRRFTSPRHQLPFLLITISSLSPINSPLLICIAEVAKKVPLLDLHAAYPVPSISCYCWQLSWSPSIDPSPREKIRWRIEMDSISII